MTSATVMVVVMVVVMVTGMALPIEVTNLQIKMRIESQVFAEAESNTRLPMQIEAETV